MRDTKSIHKTKQIKKKEEETKRQRNHISDAIK